MKKWPITLSFSLCYLIFSMLLNSIGPVILQMIHTYNIPKQTVGVLEGYKDLPIALASFSAALFLSRLGYKKVLMTGLALTLIACMTMPLFPGFLTTKLLFLTIGISFALVKISLYTCISLITESKNQHAALLNFFEGIFMLGVLLGYWLFSLFFHEENNQTIHWLQIYWWIGGLCGLTLVITKYVTFPEPHSQSSISFYQHCKSMIILSIKPLVIIFIASLFLYVLLEQSISTWLPAFNNEILKCSKKMSVQAVAIFAAALVAGRLISSVLLQKILWHRLLIFCLLAISTLILIVLPLCTPAITTTMTWKTAPAALFLLPLIGFFMAPIYPAINSVMLTSLPKSQHASMAGLFLLFSALGGTSGSMITGNLFTLIGGKYAFYSLLIPIGLLLFFFLKFRFLTNNTNVNGLG